MHTLSVRTKFTFGNHVQFDSPTQGRSGSGTVWAITADAERRLDYMIEVHQDGDCYLQPSILEEEMALLANDKESKGERGS